MHNEVAVEADDVVTAATKQNMGRITDAVQHLVPFPDVQKCR